MPRSQRRARNSTNGTSRNWLFTYYPADKEGVAKPGLPQDPEEYKGLFNEVTTKFLIFQRELCPRTNRLHWQGFVVFRSSVRQGGCQSKLGLDPKLHCDAAGGTALDNIVYCSKEESRIDGPWEMGERPSGQGSRSDLEKALVDFEKEGESMDALATKHPLVFIKFFRGFRELRAHRLRRAYPNDETPEVYWYWGPTGTSKSFVCRARAPEAYRLEPPIGTKNLYFYGYDGETDIIFEDYDGYGGFRWLLVFLSEGRMQCNASGYGVAVRRTRVFFNSERSPRDTFPTECSSENGWAQLRRRITTIFHCTAPYVGGRGSIREQSGSDHD